MQTPILSEKVHNVMSQQNTITELRKASGSLEKLRNWQKKKKKTQVTKMPLPPALEYTHIATK